MGERGRIEIWKEYEFKGKYPSVVPPGESKFSGPCLRNRLLEAGIFTDLPHWTRSEDTKAICDDLGLRCHTRGSASFPKNGEYIIGRYEGPDKGHFERTTNLEETLKSLGPDDIFAIIEIPSRK
jgi:hypothetical protein